MSDVDTDAIYALISPDGKLTFHPGGPKQMLQDVAVTDAPACEFTFISPSTHSPGLYGCITSTGQGTAPPNPLAATVIPVLGGPLRDQWFGVLGICGSKIGNPTGVLELAGLIAAQQRLIRSVVGAARERGW